MRQLLENDNYWDFGGMVDVRMLKEARTSMKRLTEKGRKQWKLGSTHDEMEKSSRNSVIALVTLIRLSLSCFMLSKL